MSMSWYISSPASMATASSLANGMVASDTAHPEAARRYAAAMAQREEDDYDYDED